jgi:hypothetical protein
MDYFYDQQIRRYVTQFMRIFIGFQYKTGDGTLKHVPVMYGDMTRQVANIIKENSENKLPSVPRISCYITNLEMDMTRMADTTFVSKMNIRERNWNEVDGEIEYQNTQGGGYTVERLMPTPFNLTMKADIWTSNTDQKLQLMEQILMLFNPSLAIQTTDNYIDWTSLSVVNLGNINFSSRTIPQGVDSDIDICSMEFKMPMYISPPTKVKKLGVVRNLVMNVFSESGEVLGLEQLIYNSDISGVYGGIPLRNTPNNFGVLLLKSINGQDADYDLSVLNVGEAVKATGLETPEKQGDRLDWNKVLELYGGYIPGISKIYFLQSDGTEINGTFVVNEVDPSFILVNISDRPANTVLKDKTYVDAIVDPYRFNPESTFGGIANIPLGTRYLVLDDVNNSEQVGENISRPTFYAYDGPDAWKSLDGRDTVILANTIIEWNGVEWEDLIPQWSVSMSPFNNTIVYTLGDIVLYETLVFKAIANITRLENSVSPGENSKFQQISLYFTNLTTGIQYRWSGEDWLKSFEGEYRSGYWRFDLNG